MTMPIVEVTVGPRVDENAMIRLREVLPEVVSVAVECPEEPYDGRLRAWRCRDPLPASRSQ